MTLVRWDPFRNVATLQDRINRMFDEAFLRAKDFDEEVSLASWKPTVDIYDTDDAIILNVELPGVDKEKVTVDIKDNVLTLRGERSIDKEIKEENYYRRERSFGLFNRCFTLPITVNPEDIKATYKNGILTVEVPKPKEKKPKQITIDVK